METQKTPAMRTRYSWHTLIRIMGDQDLKLTADQCFALVEASKAPDVMSLSQRAGASKWIFQHKQVRIDDTRDYNKKNGICDGGIHATYRYEQPMLNPGGFQYCNPQKIATVLLYGIFMTRRQDWMTRGWTSEVVSCPVISNYATVPASMTRRS